ncbi:hypothetical protein C8P67_102169 [Flavobacterium aquicola]|uniref:Uncharacterized protein n=2 Tax=Flavobacterium aquicola TaxID=1682742 RepID=A0A3E0EUY2_9FLAO|nr:hypothetical protein C8P67_102169 [Flavobacterium aquicola]
MISKILLFLLIFLFVYNIKKIFYYIKNYNEIEEAHFKKRTNLDLTKLTKISNGRFFFGLAEYLRVKSEFYYDEKYLYVINTKNQVNKHCISNIIEITKTSIMINDRRVWKIVINKEDDKIIYKLTTNDTLSNNNFNYFLDKVNENDNSIVDSDWLW